MQSAGLMRSTLYMVISLIHSFICSFDKSAGTVRGLKQREGLACKPEVVSSPAPQESGQTLSVTEVGPQVPNTPIQHCCYTQDNSNGA